MVLASGRVRDDGVVSRVVCGQPRYTALLSSGQCLVGLVTVSLLCLVACVESSDGEVAATVETIAGPAAASGGPFTCPHHPLVVEATHGICPHCKMDLVPQSESGAFLCTEHFATVDVRAGKCRQCDRLLVSAPTKEIFACPRHPEARFEEGGECPICETKLRSILIGVVWVCPKEYLEVLGDDVVSGPNDTLWLEGQAPGFETEEVSFRGGKCSKCGRDRLRLHLGLPHGDHRPRYGGQFRMASNAWHHVEVVLADESTLHLYFFDNYTRPLLPGGFRAAVRRSRLDPAAGLVDGVEAVQFHPVEGAAYLEASIEAAPLPFYGFLEVRLDDKIERFDFAFRELSDANAVERSPSQSPERVSETLEVPGTCGEIVAAILEREVRARLRIHRNEFDRLYVPAFEAKDLALALEKQVCADSDTDERRRRELSRAVGEIVRGAWLLDFHGDQGDRRQVLLGYATFARGVRSVESLLPLLPELEDP